MNCRTFEHRLPEWLAGRLAGDEARRMDEHRAVCTACARAARAEEDLRAAWQGVSAAAPTAPDLWPRIAARLDAAAARERRRRAVAFRGRLALGAASLALAAVTFAGLSGRPDMTPPGPTPVVAASPAPALLSDLSDVSRMNPAVDDPVGMTMKEEWRQINTARAGTGVAR